MTFLCVQHPHQLLPTLGVHTRTWERPSRKMHEHSTPSFNTLSGFHCIGIETLPCMNCWKRKARNTIQKVTSELAYGNCYGSDNGGMHKKSLIVNRYKSLS